MELLGIHLIGYAGALIGTLSYLIHAPRRILILHAVSWALWGAYYGILGGLSGAIVAIVGIISCSAGAMAGPALMRRISALSLIAIWAAGLGLATSPIWHPVVFAPLVASTIEVASLRLRDRPVGFRIAAIFSNIAWVSFGVALSATAGIVFGIANILMLTTTAILIAMKSTRSETPAPPTSEAGRIDEIFDSGQPVTLALEAAVKQ